MYYAGGKFQLAKYICPILNRELRGRKYIEPFVGSCSIISGIRQRERVASDSNKSVIAMWKGLLDGSFWPPAAISDEQFKSLRDAEPSALKGYVGTCHSTYGFWFGSRIKYVKNGSTGKRHTVSPKDVRFFRQILPKLVGIQFHACDYKDWSNEKNALIYCDPPYAACSRDVYEAEFSHPEFWEWCRKMSKQNTVIVSERSAPSDFTSIWSLSRLGRVGRLAGSRERPMITENLFIHESAK